MATAQKDTVYIDVDDEITTIIEKLQNSPHKIVALVLPKRAAVLQSIVNMKLLKRSAQTAKKNIVLITSESGLLPLAGAVGVHVASSLQSKPAIPRPPGAGDIPIHEGDDSDTGDDATGEDDFDTEAAKDEPIGKLAGADSFSEPETIELDNEDTDAGAAPAAAAGAGGVKKAKNPKNKKLKIPNFNKFRLLLILLIVGAVLLISGFVWANATLSKAIITLETNSTDVDTTANLTLDPKAQTADLKEGTLPAMVVNKQKTGSQQTSTSGEKNNGNKAAGNVTLALNDCSVDTVTIPAGTGVSAGDKTFITTASAKLDSVKIAGVCRNSDFKDISTEKVGVTAQKAGSAYNIGPGNYVVAGYSNVSGSSADSMSGGTDNIVKVVTQGDIDSAKQKVLDKDKDTSAIKEELTNKLAGSGFHAISETFQAGEPSVSPSANVGDQTDTVSVSVATNYTLYGAKEADLKAIIANNVKGKIDAKKQVILKDGLNDAQIEVTAVATSGPLQLAMSTTSLAGPNIQIDKLAAQFAGKKTGEVTTIAKATPGVTDVSVKYSPFWVSKVPKKTDRIAIVIEKAGNSTSKND
jgi:hypothetical protein